MWMFEGRKLGIDSSAQLTNSGQTALKIKLKYQVRVSLVHWIHSPLPFVRSIILKRSVRYRVPWVGSVLDLCWMDKNCVALGKRLKEIRIAKGYRRAEDFALSNGISRCQYDRYEKGGNMTFVTLCRILRKLDVGLEEVFWLPRGQETFSSNGE